MTKPPIVLEPFQVTGAQALAANAHHLLGDEPGLGKTLQALAAAALIKARKILVICPASVRTNWEAQMREVREAGLLIDGRNIQEWARGVELRVISYDGASATPGEDARASGPYDVLVSDEAHFLKNLAAKRTHAVLGKDGLARLAAHVWPMTGTPVLNRPVELYPILKTLHPLFREISYSAFTQRYCGAYFDGRQMNVRGASRIAELAGMLAPFMTRRTKRQVFPNRKEPIVSKVEVQIGKKAYTELERAQREEVSSNPALADLQSSGNTSRLLALLGEAKVPAVCDFIVDQLETVEKVAIYAHHRRVIGLLAHAFRHVGVAVCQGGLGDAEKEASISKFQGDGCRVFIGQRQAAGVGINGLQRVCSTVVLAEPSWVPGETEQIIGRFDRIGQTEEIVNVYLIYAKDTLDAHVMKVHDRKVAVVGQLVSGRAEVDPREILGDLA